MQYNVLYMSYILLYQLQKRIVGGTEASINEFPLMAGLVDKGTGSRFCGGSIITNTFILTAAHCLDDTTASDVRVAVGDHDMAGRVRTGYEQSIDALRFIIHNKWNTKRVVNDIAIIQLARKINFNQNVGPVCLPSSVVDLEGQTVTAMGWGLTKTFMENDRGMLRKVDLKVEDLLPCVKAYGHMINFHKPTQICSYGRNKDTCQGDSGGPLVWLDPQTNRLTQVGLVSFGAECGSTSPGVNTDVAVFMPWINSVLKSTIIAEL
ncbi:unnamed protein product [Nesidiocoris tenuis]|uniref:Peptidase S1 domain-containing protein n=1 Tax=Nesidiocoris tenuis TaxID=355587 RepID=A0A6H5HCL6_9HEMI|nr:unnamed protein product [Nesidiocoris tenuis]CAB0015722.1 unnamed protein product [Nesidiocoris tenuis]